MTTPQPVAFDAGGRADALLGPIVDAALGEFFASQLPQELARLFVEAEHAAAVALVFRAIVRRRCSCRRRPCRRRRPDCRSVCEPSGAVQRSCLPLPVLSAGGSRSRSPVVALTMLRWMVPPHIGQSPVTTRWPAAAGAAVTEGSCFAGPSPAGFSGAAEFGFAGSVGADADPFGSAAGAAAGRLRLGRGLSRLGRFVCRRTGRSGLGRRRSRRCRLGLVAVGLCRFGLGFGRSAVLGSGVASRGSAGAAGGGVALSAAVPSADVRRGCCDGPRLGSRRSGRRAARHAYEGQHQAQATPSIPLGSHGDILIS